MFPACCIFPQSSNTTRLGTHRSPREGLRQHHTVALKPDNGRTQSQQSSNCGTCWVFQPEGGAPQRTFFSSQIPSCPGENVLLLHFSGQNCQLITNLNKALQDLAEMLGLCPRGQWGWEHLQSQMG